MKRTEYYNSQEELNNYYPDGIPSTVLAIVKGEEGKSVLFTTSNNESAKGTTQDQGGYNIDEDTQEKIEVSYEFATDTGASKTYVADYVSTYGGGEAPDMTAYVSKVELSNCGYITAQDVPAPDLSAYVSKTELSNCGYITAQDVPAPDLSSYATISYVTGNYFQKSGGDVSGNITLTNDIAYLNTQPLNIRFQKDGSNQNLELNFKTNTFGISNVSFGNDGKGWIEQWQIVAMNNKVKTDHFTYTYFKGDIFAKGIGGFDGTNQANAYTLAYVINEIQTTLGTAASVAEAIVGE